jgi:hypothetical protein
MTDTYKALEVSLPDLAKLVSRSSAMEADAKEFMHQLVQHSTMATLLYSCRCSKGDLGIIRNGGAARCPNRPILLIRPAGTRAI